ncbi:hypothetical protein KVR01_011964 [Diaporthe batatas]|uniref:uncharacterized protein n=1 Tax=Diaporthe batatas TaxID=748121 RepID=UPI001D035F01|nr:uncharacterized protein KVR01_011964 [Diaporthe batatas]KAG8158203.1 hypothetical protein KVR01_011964 [Diaporthe batatas]
MALGPWLQRCTPGVSSLMVIFLLTFSESFFILYTLFVHLVIFAMPLRIFRGARLATQQIRATLQASQQETGRDEDPPSHQPSSADLIHVTIIPSYKESIQTLQDTLRILASHPLAKTTYDIFLAMEERDPSAVKVSEALISKFRPSFLDIQYCLHPSDIPAESLGKSANVGWTATEVERKYLGRQGFRDVLVTVMDSDTHLLGTYYSLIRQRHHALRQESGLEAMTLYCAPIVFDRNAHLVPRLVRAADMGWSCSGLSCFKHPDDFRGVVFPTSVYTLPLSLVSAVGGWDTGPGAIGEDMHMMLKCYFATNGRLNIESIPSPASMSNVTSGATGWSGWVGDHKARYFQGLRHMWGCLDSGYAVASWHQMASSSSAGNEIAAHNFKKDDTKTRSSLGVGKAKARASKRRLAWLRNAVLFLRLFEAHILPLHISCILLASSYYSSNLNSYNTSPYLGVVLKLTEYARTVNGILMAICLTTAYADFQKVCVQTKHWEMRQAGALEPGKYSRHFKPPRHKYGVWDFALATGSAVPCLERSFNVSGKWKAYQESQQLRRHPCGTVKGRWGINVAAGHGTRLSLFKTKDICTTCVGSMDT